LFEAGVTPAVIDGKLFWPETLVDSAIGQLTRNHLKLALSAEGN
jgi:hypothetical protein